jgi:hypothetical protein
MSKLMSVLGIVLLAIGVALALVGFVNPAQMQVYGLTMDTAAILLTGGILSIGLGGVIGALLGNAPAASKTVEIAPPEVELASESVTIKTDTPAIETPAPVDQTPARIRFNGFGRKAAVVTGAAATAAVATEVVSEATAAPVTAGKSAVDETIAALEQAKADIANAIGGVTTMAEAKVEEVSEESDDEVETEEDGSDGELYVLEEREIRGRPARILSDNTVEAETDEGWMRFENLEHLNEYLDAAGEPT